MIRESRFVLSRKQVAVYPPSFRQLDARTYPGNPGNTFNEYAINAVWYRRRKGATVASWGTVRRTLGANVVAADWQDYLTRAADGRYGPECLVRWDGRTTWADSMVSLHEVTGVVDQFLRPLLAHPVDARTHLGVDPATGLPNGLVLPGWDGWWRWTPDQS